MNKTQLAAALSEKLGLSKKVSVQAIDALEDLITESLAQNDPVRLIGFGTFSVTERKARVGRNPQTGKDIKIPARKSPKFTPGAELKAAVNKKKTGKK